MHLNKIILTINILTCNILVFGQSNILAPNDTLVYYWGSELHSSTLMLYNTTSTYSYLIKEDLWIHSSNGSYNQNGDTLTLTCKNNCSNEFEYQKPIIIEQINSDFIGNTAIILNNLGDTLENYHYKIVDSNNYYTNGSKTIEIWNENSLIYIMPVRNINANGFIIVIPLSSEHPEYIFFEKKIISFSKEFLLVDGRKFKKMIKN